MGKQTKQHKRYNFLPTERRSGESYRYGHNSQERVEDIASGHYTALFWEYDARSGRRWNLDPVPQVSISDYACFGNNPVLASDLNGDKFDPESEEHLKKTKEYIAEKKGNIMAKIEGLNREIEERMTSGGESSDDLKRKVSILQKQVEDLVSLEEDIVAMEKDIDHLFMLRVVKDVPGGKPTGGTNYDNKNNGVLMRFVIDDGESDPRYDRAVHELIHGSQYLKKQLSFKQRNGSTDPKGYYDLKDEEQAYRIQTILNLKAGKNLGVTDEYEIYEKITVGSVKEMMEYNHNRTVGKMSQEDRNSTNTVIKVRPNKTKEE